MFSVPGICSKSLSAKHSSKYSAKLEDNCIRHLHSLKKADNPTYKSKKFLSGYSHDKEIRDRVVLRDHKE